MRERKPALVVTFDTATAAMAAEAFFLAHGLPGRIIPVPREITAGCGLSWKAPPEAADELAAALEGAGLSWAAMKVLVL